MKFKLHKKSDNYPCTLCKSQKECCEFNFKQVKNLKIVSYLKKKKISFSETLTQITIICIIYS